MTLALELVNSLWWRGRGDAAVDRLDDPDWLASFSSGLGLPRPADLQPLRALRAELIRLVERQTGLEVLEPFLARGTLRRRLTADGRLELAPAELDWDWGLSEIAASFVELLADGERERLKVCANEECGWSFYDTSRNRSRRWCSSSLCGNTDKVRRFRERRRGLQRGA